MNRDAIGIFYDDLNLSFPLGKYICYVSKLSYEEQMRSFPSHSHSDNSWELHFITKGKGHITLKGTPYEIKEGMFFVNGPNIEHSQFSDPKNPVTEYCIYLKIEPSGAKAAHNPTFLERFLENPAYIGTDRQDVPNLLKTLFQEASDRSIGYRSAIISLVTRMLVLSVRNLKYSRDSLFDEELGATDQTFLILEECFLYEYQSITLESLAARISLSPRQTERLLHSHYGKTFLQKKTEAKMSAASILLNNPDLSVTEIADRLGYSSVEHFSYAFKKYHKASPREWRRKILSQKSK